MEKVELGQSGLYVSRVTFGAWAIGGWMWGKDTDDIEALRAMRRSVEMGVTSIDTAPVYGLGHSEKIIGRLIREVGRDKVEILTKFGWNWKLRKGEYLMDGARPGGKNKRSILTPAKMAF